ncbi:NifB/NifX family molybdenum-iron cluster-binding protein [Myxococcota bacterium]|nr:NifB/NifX family molybdenum-iron cluster-binding protein [Myxococcota bacterium]MBU1379690.1 NifB/NifX family molybdenum-iron cluster-binding protein [Myxococcota bacterium]MBU1496901.1 NifB/NifX family molybdenum-iron cluster-binding protein [Myxococcota bacterium]
MKIAVTSEGNSSDSLFDSRFGRASWFMVYDTENKNWNAVDNAGNLNAVHGAGTQSAQNIINMGVSVLVTGHCGPKAQSVLQSAGIKIFETNSGTVTEALAGFMSSSM